MLDPFNIGMIALGIYGFICMTQLSQHSMSLLTLARLNFNMFGLRIMRTENVDINLQTIKLTCYMNYVIEVLNLERKEINGKRLENYEVNKEYENKIKARLVELDPEFPDDDQKFPDKIQSLLTLIKDTYANLVIYSSVVDFCKEMSKFINVALFTFNKNKHAKLSMFIHEKPFTHWILLVDEPDKANPKFHENQLFGLGILTTNKRLFAEKEDVNEKSTFVFDNDSFINLMNKYKPPILEDKKGFHSMFKFKGPVKGRLQKFSRIRRIVRNVRVLKDDHVTLSRTYT